jgi:hypothetical protein
MADLPPLVDVGELGTWLRVETLDTVWAELVLSMASDLVRSETGLTWEDVDVPSEARAVTLAVAARVYRNPDAASHFSETTGPFTRSMSFPNGEAVGLFLTGRERAMLARFRSATRGLWSLGTTRGEDHNLTGYVPVEGSPNDFPWYAD